MNYGGVWYAPGGNSFTAHLIKDAGGCYLWASDTSRELTFTLEEIMLVADSADVWVNPGAFASAEDMLAAEPRIKHIRAFREKRVCQNDGRKGPGGGNDFYESAVAYPAELLQSLRNCIQNATNGADSVRKEFDWYRNIFIF
jgi:iron complex transport system substrate-binding protein